MYSDTTVALVAATFTTFIQPCPAPPLVAAGLGATLGAGALGGVAGELFGKLTDVFTGGDGETKRALDENAEGLGACVTQALATKGHGISAEPGEGTSIIIDGLPKVCLAEFKKYNDDPANAAAAPFMGTTEFLNSTAIKVDGLHPDQLATIENQIKTVPQHAPQRRSMRFEKY